MKHRICASVLTCLLAASLTLPVWAGEWTSDKENGGKTYTSRELDYQITFPAQFVASELSGEIAQKAGNAACDFAVADHPVDMESAVTVAAGSCRFGETMAQGDAAQLAAYYETVLTTFVKCSRREDTSQVELGGYSYWKIAVREENGLFLQPMNMDFYLRDCGDRIVILGFAYYDGYEEEIGTILESIRRPAE